ncbi:MAG TPA: hypothetical protein VFS08_13675 [Gemmatimonadaceae bacterium]|nr:hypothetical protein [Gemmatimonadaceae bacterium]
MMSYRSTRAAALSLLLLATVVAPSRAAAQHGGHGGHVMADTASAPAQPTATDAAAAGGHAGMWMRPLGGGWRAAGMAQLFPTLTAGSVWRDEALLGPAGAYLTQPVVMLDVGSPDARVVLRTTLDFEAWTQPDGELTFGGWGEGFLDSRHPHTLLHEAMLAVNWWDVAGGALSLSAGKGFAPYGTDDPMSRPALKYPTNHHLSQVLERWTANAAYVRGGWSVEGGVFAAAEPVDPYDLGNTRGFGESWSARLARRFGGAPAQPTAAPWELSASVARLKEEHDDAATHTTLWNAAVRHEQRYGATGVYALLEASRSEPEADDGYFSILGETQLMLGAGAAHRPYLRLEYATRPEYERQGAPDTPGFFRYDHDDHAIGATRWLITTAGYGYDVQAGAVSVRPFAELQHFRVRAERGGIEPAALYGRESFWSLSAGARIFFGGGPMRMGAYGALDPMAGMLRMSEGHGGH